MDFVVLNAKIKSRYMKKLEVEKFVEYNRLLCDTQMTDVLLSKGEQVEQLSGFNKIIRKLYIKKWNKSHQNQLRERWKYKKGQQDDALERFLRERVFYDRNHPDRTDRRQVQVQCMKVAFDLLF